MYELAEEKLQITLALSLHASSQEKREELMPIANKYSLDEVLDACRNYFWKKPAEESHLSTVWWAEKMIPKRMHSVWQN